MGLTCTAPPIVDPVTLDEAKTHCRVTNDDEDGNLIGYLLAARAVVEGDTRRALITQGWTLTIDRDWPMHRDAISHQYDNVLGGYSGGGWNPTGIVTSGRYRRIVLPKPPTQSVTSIQYVDLAGVTQTLDPSQYVMGLADTGETWIEPAYGVTWPQVRAQLSSITVNFIAGYGDTISSCPEVLRQAILMLVGMWFDFRVPVAMLSATSELPFGISSLIQRYRLMY